MLFGGLPDWEGFQEVIDILERRDLPFVFMPMPPVRRYVLRTKSLTPTITFDCKECVRQVVERLRDLGHRRVVATAGCGATGRFLGAYIDSALECGVAIGDDLLFLTQAEFRGIITEFRAFSRHVVERLLSMGNRPTAVYAMEGQLAITVIEELLKHGIDVGKQISVVTTGIDAMVRERSPVALAGTQASYFDLGEVACRTLWEVIEGTYDGPETVYVPRKWIDGPSLGPAMTDE